MQINELIDSKPIELSDKPGLGLEINYEEITKHPPLKKTHARGGTIKGI